MYYTTLNKIREHDPCVAGWQKLLTYLGKTKADDEPLALATILEANGIEDAIWALRAVDDIDDLARLFAVRCVREHCQHLLTDPRSLAALDVSEMYAIGEATGDDMNAAYDAARDAARGLARGLAYDAAYDAAWVSAWVSAWVAISTDFRVIFCEMD